VSGREEERTGDERLRLGNDLGQLPLGPFKGVPFIADHRLPDCGFDGIVAAFCCGLDHLLIALRCLVKPALREQHVALERDVEQQCRRHLGILFMELACLQKPLPGHLHLAQQPVAPAHDTQTQTTQTQLPWRQEG